MPTTPSDVSKSVNGKSVPIMISKVVTIITILNNTSN